MICQVFGFVTFWAHVFCLISNHKTQNFGGSLLEEKILDVRSRWNSYVVEPKYARWRQQDVSFYPISLLILAPSTRMRIFLNPQLFLSGYGYRPHAYGEFASKSRNFWIRSPEWKFLNPITFRMRVDRRIRIFSYTMTSQNWRQCLPLKFKLGRRSKVNSFCAPCAYFQSLSLYAAKMWLYYMLK